MFHSKRKKDVSGITPSLDLPQVVFLSDEVGQTSEEVARRRLACLNSILICILLAGNYRDDVMDAL